MEEIQTDLIVETLKRSCMQSQSVKRKIVNWCASHSTAKALGMNA
jgi:hypothetical protein